MVFSKAERTRGQVVRCFTHSGRGKMGAFTRREKDTGMGWGGEGKSLVMFMREGNIHIAKREGRTAFMGGAFFFLFLFLLLCFLLHISSALPLLSSLSLSYVSPFYWGGFSGCF